MSATDKIDFKVTHVQVSIEVGCVKPPLGTLHITHGMLEGEPANSAPDSESC